MREEDEQLIKEFLQSVPLSQIALSHKRTRNGIRSRLIHLGYLPKPARRSVLPLAADELNELAAAVSHVLEKGSSFLEALSHLSSEQIPARDPPFQRHGKTWTSAEDAQLGNEFINQIPVPQIAFSHKRTQGAIHSRLERLGYIERHIPRAVLPDFMSETDSVATDGAGAGETGQDTWVELKPQALD